MATLQLLSFLFTLFYTLVAASLTYVDLQTPPLSVDLSQLSPDFPLSSPDLPQSSIYLPIAIFTPTDFSLHTCPSCSIPLILHEHTVPRLYPLQLLRNLAFTTKIQTLASNCCLTVTSTTNTADESGQSTTIFINGAEITHPDLFNNGLIIVHGIEGCLSHLSSVSCRLEHMTTLSISPPTSSSTLNFMPLMLKDALLRLRISDYSALALSLRDKYKELLSLRSLTVFGLNDTSIFTDGPNYITDLTFHILPNRRLMAADLENLPENTVLPTMEAGENLIVTTAGGGETLAQMRINYMEMKSYDIVFNRKIVIHGFSMPFSRIMPSPAPEVNLCRVDKPECSFNGAVAVGEMVVTNSASESTTKAALTSRLQSALVTEHKQGKVLLHCIAQKNVADAIFNPCIQHENIVSSLDFVGVVWCYSDWLKKMVYAPLLFLSTPWFYNKHIKCSMKVS